MTSKNNIKYVAMIAATVAIIVIVTSVNIDFFSQNEDKEEIFPGILGDMVLNSNDTGIDAIRNIVAYDDFRGNIIQGYKANYTGSNGTMIIFIAQTRDNESAIQSIRDMVVRSGYNDSANITDNDTVMKLPVENPEVFLIQKSDKVPWHYVFAKLNKVYWIGFSNQDIEYQMMMLIEIYRGVAEKINV